MKQLITALSVKMDNFKSSVALRSALDSVRTPLLQSDQQSRPGTSSPSRRIGSPSRTGEASPQPSSVPTTSLHTRTSDVSQYSPSSTSKITGDQPDRTNQSDDPRTNNPDSQPDTPNQPDRSSESANVYREVFSIAQL